MEFVATATKQGDGGGRTMWNNQPGSSSFSQVQAPSNVEEVAEQVVEQARSETDDRVRAYETPVTAETLRTPAE